MNRRSVVKGAAALAVVPFLPLVLKEKTFNISGHITAYFNSEKLYASYTQGATEFKEGDYVFMQFPSSTQTVKLTKVDEKGRGYYKNIWGYEVPLDMEYVI